MAFSRKFPPWENKTQKTDFIKVKGEKSNQFVFYSIHKLISLFVNVTLTFDFFLNQ